MRPAESGMAFSTAANRGAPGKRWLRREGHGDRIRRAHGACDPRGLAQSVEAVEALARAPAIAAGLARASSVRHSLSSASRLASRSATWAISVRRSALSSRAAESTEPIAIADNDVTASAIDAESARFRRQKSQPALPGRRAPGLDRPVREEPPQVFSQRSRRAVAAARLLGDRFQDDGLEIARDSRIDPPRPGWILMANLLDHTGATARCKHRRRVTSS